MEHQIIHKGEKIDFQTQRDHEQLELSLNGTNYSYQISGLGDGTFILRDGTRIHRVKSFKVENKIFVVTDNGSFTFEVPHSKDSDAFDSDHGEHGDKSKVIAPMPGKVVKILVQTGDKVEAKQKLLIVEAMKMENPLVAPFQAEVKKINCTEGELVDSETILIELQPLS